MTVIENGIDKLTRRHVPTPLTQARIAPCFDDSAHYESGFE
jgi:hypothetical protein